MKPNRLSVIAASALLFLLLSAVLCLGEPGIDKLSPSIDKLSLCLKILSLVLTVAAAVTLFSLFFGLIEGRRRWNARGLTYTLLRLPLLAALSAVPALWWRFCFPVIFDLLPRAVMLPGVALTMVCGVLMMFILFPSPSKRSG